MIQVKVMAKIALYWFGNECMDYTGGWDLYNLSRPGGYISENGYITKQPFEIPEGVAKFKIAGDFYTQQTSPFPTIFRTDKQQDSYARHGGYKVLGGEFYPGSGSRVGVFDINFQSGDYPPNYFVFGTHANGTVKATISNNKNKTSLYSKLHDNQTATATLDALWVE